MHPIRKKRLLLLIMVVLGSSLIAGLTLFALRQNMNLFFTPTQVQENIAPTNQSIRVGGLVVDNSLSRTPDSLQISFVITDKVHQIQIFYEGILPDLFKEGQGIVAKGYLNDNNQFIATEVLAKHDENYMPPEVASALEEAGHPMGK